jgi:dihydrodipicolinate synthase/N-acetylneuraminate lyase
MTKRYQQAVLASCEIPWDEDYKLIESVFRDEVRTTIALGFNNLYIFGTAGEGYAVTLGQYKDIVQLFREEAAGDDVHPMVGVIGMSTAQVVEKIGIAHDIGFRAIQISLTPWGELSDAEYMTYFTDVCGTFPDTSFLHYNLPRPKRVLVTEDYKRLQDAVPNLVATKYTSASPNECAHLVKETDIQHFFGERNFPFGCIHGECSLLTSLGALIPQRTHEFFRYGVEGDLENLFRIHARIMTIVDDVIAAAGSKPAIDGAYDKMIVRAAGVDMPMRLLSPYQCFPEEVFEAFVKRVHDNHGDWME